MSMSDDISLAARLIAVSTILGAIAKPRTLNCSMKRSSKWGPDDYDEADQRRAQDITRAAGDAQQQRGSPSDC